MARSPDLVAPPLLGFDRGLDRLVHLRVTGAAAEISAESMADVFFCWIGIAIEQRLNCDHEARGAVAALSAAPIAIGLLDGGQSAVIGNAFHGCDVRRSR